MLRGPVCWPAVGRGQWFLVPCVRSVRPRPLSGRTQGGSTPYLTSGIDSPGSTCNPPRRLFVTLNPSKRSLVKD